MAAAARSPVSSLGSAARRVRATQGRAQQFQRLFDESFVPMSLVDNERHILAANRAARLVSRMSLDELRTRRVDDLVTERMVRALESAWGRMLADGHVAGRHEIGFQDGSELTINYCAVANMLPGEHLIVFAPAAWPDDELGMTDDAIAPGATLSQREREVLTLIAAGADSDQIAEQLTISPATVKTHVKNAHQRLGARNRAHAIAMALKRGLIDVPGGH